MTTDLGRINAAPTKEFFIDMITRDIGLQDCVLDLIDNSLQGIIREYDLDVMDILLGLKRRKGPRGETINLSFSRSHFTIKDTCAGISIEEAKNDVFRFGITKYDTSYAGLGVYGIGMKRALFKIGRSIYIKSRTRTEEFEVEISIDEWKNRPADWAFDFKNTAKKRGRYGQDTGTMIKITDLNYGVGDRFELTSFKNDLVGKIAGTYSLFLKKGVTIRANDRYIEPALTEFATSKNLNFAKKKISCDGVDVIILTGLTPPKDKQPHGWYIFCNGRMVMEADKSKLTGWGENFPLFHTKFNHFLGLAYFRSNDIRKLPWTTTKHEVNLESAVYQCALKEMKALGRPIIAFLSDMYPEDVEPTGVQQRDILKKAARFQLKKIPKRDTVFKPKITQKPPKQVTIQYKKPPSEVKRVKDNLGKRRMSAKKVGEYTFDYFIKKECD